MIKGSHDGSLRIAAAYAAVSAAWIGLSKHVLVALVRDPRTLERLEQFKGVAFVAVTASLLYGLLRRRFGRQESALRAVRALGRAHQMRAACEAAMARAASRRELFDAVCRIIVEEGGYAMSWVGLARDDAEKTVIPAARAGRDDGYVEAARVVWSDAARGRSPTGTAIREKRPAFARVRGADMSPWREVAERRGFKACVSLPLIEGTRAIGALTMYSDREDDVDPAEDALLRSLADSLGYALDNLARRELEQELRQAQKMEVVGTLAGGVAHDFNNVLTVIQGHCALLSASRLPSEADRESVAEIESSAERAAALTRQLLALGRRQPMRARRLDLNDATGRTTRMLRRLVPERIALEAVLSREPLFARADPAMLDQVLMNLVLNARDAISGAGRVLIETAVAPGVHAPPHARELGRGWAVVRVTDGGCGIKAEDLPRIFEPFFTTKAAGKGTGLGLAVVDGILRQHKGWATVASEAGRGSTFSVFLPLDPVETGEDPAEPPPAVLRGTETLLLAEDEAALRRLCARHLSALGYRVLEAADGDRALRAWARRKGPVPLLITDMVMPGATDGTELARRLREDDPRLRVIYISGYHAALTDGSAKLEEGSAFLQKPFKPDELARLVRSLLDR